MTWLLRFLQITAAAALAFLFRKKNRLIAFSCQVFGYVLVKEREKRSKSRHLHFLMLLFFDENEYKIAVQTLKK